MTLSLQSISKRFGTTVALDDVSFEVRPGEVHALLGENGAGKTTLMRIARGLLRPDAGTVESASGSDRIGMAHQHFTSIAAFTVAENIALVAGWRESGAALQRRAAAVIEKLGMPLNAAARVRDLTVQLRQRLEIIQALAAGAEVLLLDEPTAVLAPRETAELLAQIRQFAASGGAVVLITHKLAEALQVADRVTVLRRGKVVLTELAESLDAATLSRAMIGDQTTPTDTPRAGRSSGGPGQKLLLWQDLELHTGELIGVAAIEGNGQRALLRGIVDVASSRLDGRVAFIPEDRLGEALLADRPLTANWVLGNLDRVSEWLDWTAIDLETGALIARHDVRTTGTAATPAELSGGNQQKFVLGRALDRQPVLIVAEDPTRGLDIRATAEVHAALGAARDAGACVVVHSSDLDEVLALADRLLVMADGVIRELPVDAPRDTIGDAMLGIAVPG